MMDIAIAQVIAQLQVDAADVLLVHPHSKMLDYLTGSGFRTQAARRASGARGPKPGRTRRKGTSPDQGREI